VLSKTQQNESGLSQHKQGSLISMSDRLLAHSSVTWVLSVVESVGSVAEKVFDGQLLV